MTFSVRPATALALCCLFATSFTHAQRGGGGGMRFPSGVAISPDGTTLAATVGSREGSQLHLTTIADPDPAKDRIIAPNGATNCSNSSPVWSPDGAMLAYTSTCTAKEEKPGQAQIFLWSKATGESKQLTHVTGPVQAGGLVAQRQDACVSLCAERLALGRRARRHEALGWSDR